MINKEILEAQRDLYRAGRNRAVEALERAKADVAAFNGAIEACDSLLAINSELERSASLQDEKEKTNA